MLSSLARLGRATPGPADVPVVNVPTVRVIVYTDLAVLTGELLSGPLHPSDSLAPWTPIALRDVEAVALADGRLERTTDLSVAPSEIVAVSMPVPADSRSPNRRRVTFGAGPFFIEGFVAVLPGTDVLAGLRRRSRIDLFDATIEYWVRSTATSRPDARPQRHP